MQVEQIGRVVRLGDRPWWKQESSEGQDRGDGQKDREGKLTRDKENLYVR